MDFKKLAALLGVAPGAAITEENMNTAEAKIAQLENDKSAAESALATAKSDLTTMTTRATTAEADLKTANASLETAQKQVKTLEGYKKAQAPADERAEDEANELDAEPEAALTGWEATAAASIAKVRKRYGKTE